MGGGAPSRPSTATPPSPTPRPSTTSRALAVALVCALAVALAVALMSVDSRLGALTVLPGGAGAGAAADGDRAAREDAAYDASVDPVDDDADELRPANSTTKLSVPLPRTVAARSPKRNVLFVKTPKVGGTTVAQAVRRYAAFHHMDMPYIPGDHVTVRTCSGAYQDKAARWEELLASNKGRRIEAFASHACLMDFMLEPRCWTQRRKPLLLSVVRDPFAQFVSKYRFTKLCCDVEHWDWCAGMCGKGANGLTVEQFAQDACGDEKRRNTCNPQTTYLGVGTIDIIVSRFDLVLMLERLDEGLALLHVLFAFPLHVLVTLPSNSNTGPYPVITPQLETFVRKRMWVDNRLYQAVHRKFNATVRALTPDQRRAFEETTVFIAAANRAVKTKCAARCGRLESISRERKDCDGACLEDFDRDVFAGLVVGGRAVDGGLSPGGEPREVSRGAVGAGGKPVARRRRRRTR